MNAPRTAAGVVLGYLHVQAQALRHNGEQFIAGESTAIHQLRVTTRRLRSVLASFELVLDAETSRVARAELKWFAGVLGAARDVEVIRARLLEHLEGDGLARFAGVDRRLGTESREARAAVGQVILSPRFTALVVGLERMVGAGTLSAGAGAGAGAGGAGIGPSTDVSSSDVSSSDVSSSDVSSSDVSSSDVSSSGRSVRAELTAMIRKDLKRLRRSVRRVRKVDDQHDRDLVLHEVRKNAKRLRYACECAAPDTGKRVRRLGRAAQVIQEVLGEHQDSVALREWLSTQDDLPGAQIVTAEELLAFRSEDAFHEAWGEFPRKL